MTTAKAASAYRSGFCGVRAHERCRGTYAGTACTCDCHQEPEPEPVDLMDELDLMDDVVGDQPTRHCPTCTCGEPR